MVVTMKNLFIEFSYMDLPTLIKFHAESSEHLFRAFLTNNLLYRDGSAECDIVAHVSEQMKISPSVPL